MRIVMSGASGHIGGVVAAQLGAHHDVVSIVRQPAGVSGTTAVADLSQGWSTAILPSASDAVIHLAQSDRFREFPGGAADVFAVNLAATARLLDYAVASGAQHFVLASTGGLYGSVAGLITERTPLNLPDGNLRHYFETKSAAEHLALAYRAHLRVSIVRPFFIYGRGQRASKLLPRLIDSVRRGTPVRLRGENGTVMNPAHVDDAAAVITSCVETGHQGIVNIAGGQVTSVREMTVAIASAMGTNAVFEPEDGDPERYVVDTTVMRALIRRSPANFDDRIGEVLNLLV